jgi:hypothetical protein
MSISHDELREGPHFELAKIIPHCVSPDWRSRN